MKAQVVQFRRGRHTIHKRHFILDVGAKSRGEAEKFIGSEVIWVSHGRLKKKIKGKISSPHGKKGLVRAVFEKGLPGQAITEEVEVESGGKSK
ncbi:MAG: 50S ribosomal protein L35ae [Candidatus Pacearchaeota archaeon]